MTESVEWERLADHEETQQPIKPARCRCYMPTTATPPPVITAADQVRRNLRMSAKWARFGRLMVEQLLSEHDAAVERAETAEAQVKRMQAVINEDITAYEAELNDIHKARDHWQDETVRATERAENAEAERNAARRELAEVRGQLQPARPSICDYCGMDRRVHDLRTWMAHCEATAAAHPDALKQMRAERADDDSVIAKVGEGVAVVVGDEPPSEAVVQALREMGYPVVTWKAADGG